MTEVRTACECVITDPVKLKIAEEENYCTHCETPITTDILVTYDSLGQNSYMHALTPLIEESLLDPSPSLLPEEELPIEPISSLLPSLESQPPCE